MKSRKNRLFFALALLALAVLWASVSAADIVDQGTAGAISWKLETDGTLTISGNANMVSTDRPWINYKYQIKNVVIDPGVNEIAKNAFNGCFYIKSVSIPSTVKTIGEYAFYDCRDLESVTIPEMVTCIENETFNNCESLKEVTFLGNVVEIKNKAFMGCESLANLFLPDHLQTIGNQAFRFCSSLHYCTIPDSVTSIGSWAFADCTGLQKVWIPGSSTSIADSDAFEDTHTFPAGTAVYCYANTPTWTWANEHGNEIVLLDGSSGINPYISAHLPETIMALTDRGTQIPYDYFPKVPTLYDINWESSNEDVVIVNYKGMLAPVAKGDATVTLKINGVPFRTNVSVRNPVESLSLPDSLEVEKGQSIEVPLTIIPEDAGVDLDYHFDETYYAAFNDSGLLEGQYAGETLLTVTDKYTGVSVTTTIRVTRPPEPLVPKRVTLTPSETTLLVGNTVQLQATVTMSDWNDYQDNSLVTFTSYNPAVAEVDENGLVTAVSPGTAYVRADTENAYFANCLVTVDELAPSGVSLDCTGAAMRVGQKLQLQATVSMSDGTVPEDGNSLVAFTSSDPSVAYVDESGLVTALDSGTATITAATANRRRASCTVSISTPEIITIPGESTVIRSYTFTGTSGDKYVIQSSAETVTIEDYAFTDLTDVLIVLPANVQHIDPNAFAGSEDKITFITPAGSYAAGWAEDHGVPCILQ